MGGAVRSEAENQNVMSSEVGTSRVLCQHVIPSEVEESGVLTAASNFLFNEKIIIERDASLRSA
jgi:hypothetical protein